MPKLSTPTPTTVSSALLLASLSDGLSVCCMINPYGKFVRDN